MDRCRSAWQACPRTAEGDGPPWHSATRRPNCCAPVAGKGEVNGQKRDGTRVFVAVGWPSETSATFWLRSSRQIPTSARASRPRSLCKRLRQISRV